MPDHAQFTAAARVGASVAGFVAYPVLVHLGVMQAEPRLMAAGLACMLLTVTSAAWLRRGAVGVGVAGLAALALIGLGGLLPVQRAAEIPPVLFAGSLALVFGATLLPGRVPVIAQIIQRVHGAAGHAQIEADVLRYARGVTWLWTLTFVGIAAASLATAAWASPLVWSLMTNLVNYLVLVVVMLGEYAVRKLRFGARLPYDSFVDFIKKMRAAGWRPAPASGPDR